MIKSAILTALTALTVTATGGAVASVDTAPAVANAESSAVCTAEMPVDEDFGVESSFEKPNFPKGNGDGAYYDENSEIGTDTEKGDSHRHGRRHGHRQGERPHEDKNGDSRPEHRPMPLPYFDKDTSPKPPAENTDIMPIPDFEGDIGTNGKGLPRDAAPYFDEEAGADSSDGAHITPCGISEYVLSKITPEFIAVYENKVARTEIVSDMSAAEISLAASELGVSEKKFTALLLLQDLVSRTSKPVPVSVLANMSDGELLRLARRSAKAYADSLSESEREELKAEFKAAAKAGKNG